MAAVPRPSAPLSQALAPRRSNVVPVLLLIVGIVVAVGAAAYGWIESRRTEQVLVALAPIPAGHQITAEAVGMIELPRYRPAPLAGLSDVGRVVGMWTTRDIGTEDLLKPDMLTTSPPDQPVYPNGARLTRNMVPIPFSTTTIGPLSDRDLVNIGFSDPSGDPLTCQQAQAAATDGAATPSSVPSLGVLAHPYACRILQRVRVLYVDEGAGLAYLELTPRQSHLIWAIQATSLALWGERYGTSSDPLPQLDRLDLQHVTLDDLTNPISATQRPIIPGTPPESR